MKDFIKKLVAGLSAVLVTVAMPYAAVAYGPTEGNSGRKYFDYNNTSTYPNYPAFNSFTNNPTWGFEPDFMSIKPADSTHWADNDKITLEPGKTYDVITFYHNNAPAETNATSGARLTIDFPYVMYAGKDNIGSAILTANNTTPQKVYSDLTFNVANDLVFRYVPDSAVINYNDAAQTDKKLPNQGNNLFESNGGQLIGENLDGVVLGCDKHAATVQFKMVADQPNFDLSKQVRINNDGKATGGWTENVKAQPGDTVNFLLTYKNTGTVQQNNVVIKDKLPQYLTYVPGSTRYYNATYPTSTGGHAATDDVTGNGLNLGNYAPGATAMVTFSAKVAAKQDLPCGTTKIKNIGRAETDNGSKEDPAEVEVDGDTCVPPKPDNPECKPGIPEGDPRCTDTPVTPSTLPKTGPGEILAGGVGLASVGAATTYYINSRKKLGAIKR
jgi:uncharacterized repeat protein (TIGR01451 family)